MTIREANIQIKQIDNDIEILERKKELEFMKTQPGAIKTDKEIVDGIQVIDKNFNYVVKSDEITRELNLKLKEKENLENWVDKELRILKEYEPLKAKIVRLREGTQKMTWNQIANAVGYTERQCRRIYRNYTDRRLSEIKEATEYLKNN